MVMIAIFSFVKGKKNEMLNKLGNKIYNIFCYKDNRIYSDATMGIREMSLHGNIFNFLYSIYFMVFVR